MNDNPAHDSITLSQLKSAVNAQAKVKVVFCYSHLPTYAKDTS